MNSLGEIPTIIWELTFLIKLFHQQYGNLYEKTHVFNISKLDVFVRRITP